MELLGVIYALKSMDVSEKITLYVDSQYVKNGCESWMRNWKRNGWKTAAGGAVKNQDLWEELDLLLQKNNVSFIWVKGHSGDVFNERVDTLANDAIASFLKKD